MRWRLLSMKATTLVSTLSGNKFWYSWLGHSRTHLFKGISWWKDSANWYWLEARHCKSNWLTLLMPRSWLGFLLAGRATLPRSILSSFKVCSSLGSPDTWIGISFVFRLSIYRRQHKTRIFNVGNRRRLAQSKDDSDHPTEHDANFFDPNNAEYTATREHLAMDTLEELLHWLMEENGSVGILGAYI